MSAYIKVVNGVINVLDSIARYPGLWLITTIALVITVKIIYMAGKIDGRLGL